MPKGGKKGEVKGGGKGKGRKGEGGGGAAPPRGRPEGGGQGSQGAAGVGKGVASQGTSGLTAAPFPAGFSAPMQRGPDAGPLNPGMLTQATITAAMAAGLGGVGGLAGVPGLYNASNAMAFPSMGLDALGAAHSAGLGQGQAQGFPGFSAQLGAHFQTGGHAPSPSAWAGAHAPGLGQPLSWPPLAPGSLVLPKVDSVNRDIKGSPHMPRGGEAEEAQLGGARSVMGYDTPGVPGMPSGQGLDNATAFALGRPQGAMVRPDQWLSAPAWAQQSAFGLARPAVGVPGLPHEATLSRLGANLIGTGAALGANLGGHLERAAAGGLDSGLEAGAGGIRDLASRALEASGLPPMVGGVTGLEEPDVDLLEPNQAEFEAALLVDSPNLQENSAQHFISPNRFADILFFREGAQPAFGEEKQKRDVAGIDATGLGSARHVMRVSDRQALCLCSLSPSLMFPSVNREMQTVTWTYKELNVPACQEVRNTAVVKKQLENYKYTGFCPNHVSGLGIGSEEVFIKTKGHSVRGLNLGRIVNDKRPRHMLCIQVGSRMAFLKWCTQCHNWQNFKKFIVEVDVDPKGEESGSTVEGSAAQKLLKVHTFCTVCHARQVQSREKRRLERKKRKAERDAQVEQEHLKTAQQPFKAWTAQDFMPPVYFTQQQNIAPSFM